jgi:hypothetical protein
MFMSLALSDGQIHLDAQPAVRAIAGIDFAAAGFQSSAGNR